MAIFYQDLLKFDEMAPPAEPSTPNPPTVAHPILDRSRDVVMMTADEPMFPDPNAPKYSTQDLAEELKRHGVEFELTKGKYNNKDETSVIAYDMPSDLAHQLAKKYMQESYVHIEPNGKAKLKYANGAERDNPDDTSLPLIPLEGKFRDEVGTPKVSDSEPENNFTYIPSINKYVSLDFDWGKLPSQLPSFKGEPTMKNEFTIDEVKAEIAKVLKKYQDEYESTLMELRKADKGHKGQLPHNETEERKIKHIASSYEKKGKSPEQSKAIAYATVNAQHKAEACSKCGKSECVCKGMACKKCGEMTKADMCAKCGEMSAGTKKNEAVSFMEKKGDKSAKGPQETPDKTKEVEASGSGGDIKKGKLGKAEEDVKLFLGLELMFKAEETKEESSEETSSPERESHEETPADEESKTKKSVHNIKAESSFSSEKSLVPRTAGDKAPEHSASASSKSHQPSRLGKLISAAKKAISNSAAPVGAGRIAMTGAIPNFGSRHDPHMNKK